MTSDDAIYCTDAGILNRRSTVPAIYAREVQVASHVKSPLHAALKSHLEGDESKLRWQLPEKASHRHDFRSTSHFTGEPVQAGLHGAGTTILPRLSNFSPYNGLLIMKEFDARSVECMNKLAKKPRMNSKLCSNPSEVEV